MGVGKSLKLYGIIKNPNTEVTMYKLAEHYEGMRDWHIEQAQRPGIGVVARKFQWQCAHEEQEVANLDRFPGEENARTLLRA